MKKLIKKNKKQYILLISIGGYILAAVIGLLIGVIYDFLTISTEEQLLQETNQKIDIEEPLFQEIIKQIREANQKLELLLPGSSFPRQEKELCNDDPNKILLRPAVIEGAIYEKQKKYHFLMATINVGGQKKYGILNNFIINPNLVYDISYNIDGYISDTDDIYIDQGLFSLPHNTTKFEVKTDHFITRGTFSPKYEDFTCIVTDEETNQWISFVYKRKDPDLGFNVVRILNSMYTLNHSWD